MSDQKTTRPTTDKPARERVEQEWFERLIAQLHVDQLTVSTHTARPDQQTFYESIIHGDGNRAMAIQQQGVTKFFVTQILSLFISRIQPHLPRLAKVATALTDSEVLLWIETKADDELLEDQLTEIEAEINAKFHPYRYDVEMMIVESADRLPVPPHYFSLYDEAVQDQRASSAS